MAKDIFGFDVTFLKQMKSLMRETGIQEIEIEDGDQKYIRISKKKEPVSIAAPMPAAAIQPAAAPVPASVKTPAAPAAAGPAVVKSHYEDESKFAKVKSPVIGTFYAMPSPVSPPFVKLGDIVSKDTTVCIVEAMKVMNEIKADTHGKIIEILKTSGNAVQSNEPMFIIEKM